MSTPVVVPTRERLLSAAQELIEGGGYGAASVLAIAERAGVAAGTLYRHFSSKEELFASLFRTVCDREEEAMRAAAERPPPGGTQAERLETVLITFASRALRRPRLAWALIAEPVDPLVDAERLAYRARYAALIAEALSRGIAAGELPAQDAELVAAALVGGCGEALVGPLSPLAGSGPAPGAVLDGLRTFIRRAIGAPADG
ncbi:MAG TPA: TetR/AcrR family transcriptional regulator [Solirubrobacteraceae bacterium]|nr:TetR/AcrR family transcriptional regulator [Solirubrobacteraceae bacterium]